MINPYKVMYKDPHFIAGYVIDVKKFDRYNVILLRRDRANKDSGIISIQAWQDKENDYQEKTNNIQGKFISGIVVPGGSHGNHENWKLRILITAPTQKAS